MIVNDIEFGGTLEDLGNVQAFSDLGSTEWSSEYGCGHTATSLPLVREFPVAKRVTSRPIRTSSSVRRLTTDSHGP